jgi:uncharacterized membrane protein YuzA (DUF378 family)
MKSLHMVSFVLVIVGGLNWLLVGFGYNLVDSVFGVGSSIAKLVYILVGLSAVYLVVTHKQSCKHCMAGGSGSQM